MQLKAKVRYWKLNEGMSLKDIKKRLWEEDKIKIADSTLSTWWSDKTMEKIRNIAPERLNENDVRYNPKQRPDLIVDMEDILARKVRSIRESGLPFNREILQILAIPISLKIIAYNLYDEHGFYTSTLVRLGQYRFKKVYPLGQICRNLRMA